MEFLIRVIDAGPPPGNRQAGSVIVAMPDGHPWSVAELTEPYWRIVRVGFVQAEADSLKTTKKVNGVVVAQRERLIDLTALPPDVRGTVVTITRQQALAAVRNA